MPERLKQFHLDCRGATAIEYSLIAGAIALLIATTVFAIGADASVFFDAVVDAFAQLGF